MLNGFFYAFTVLIWGSSWLLMIYQLGVVPAEQSVAYRFAVAAALIFLVLIVRREKLWVPWRVHPWLALQGMLMFCLNYVLFYAAVGMISSGLSATVFSTTSAFVALFGVFLLSQPVSARLWAGIALGLCGIALIFWPEINTLTLGDAGALGLALSIGGTLSFSLSNIVGARNQNAGMALLPMAAWAMVYGTAFLLIFTFAQGHSLTFEVSTRYILSLAALAILSSFFGFLFYLALIKRIGAARTAYTTVLFPVIALGLSSVFEAYQWSILSITGLVLVLAGNMLMLIKPSGAPIRTPDRAPDKFPDKPPDRRGYD